MTASVLTQAGYKTGLYTSPHLHLFNERIRVDNKLITNDEIVELVAQIKTGSGSRQSRSPLRQINHI